MYITLTIKAEATSKNELLNTFASKFEQTRAQFTEFKKRGIFGPPANVDLRFMAIGGGFREVAPETQEQDSIENLTDKPDV